MSVTIPPKNKKLYASRSYSPNFVKHMEVPKTNPRWRQVKEKRKVLSGTNTVDMEEYANTHRTWAEVPCEELLFEFVIILTSRCWHVQLMMCVLRSVVAVIGASCFRAAHAVQELERFIKLERCQIIFECPPMSKERTVSIAGGTEHQACSAMRARDAMRAQVAR